MKSIDFSALKGLGEELKVLAKEVPRKRQALRDKLGDMEKDVNEKLNDTRNNKTTINATESNALAKIEYYIDEILQKLEG